MIFSFIPRHTFWTNVSLPDRVKKKMVLENFFTGREKPLTDAETEEMISIMRAEKVQKEFCDFLIHRRKLYQQLSYSEYFNEKRKYLSLKLHFFNI